jgi:phosphoribosylformylglycinamidine synthase
VPDYLARIDVMLKPLVNDPQGLAVRDGLHQLGHAGVAGVRVGKHIEVRLTALDAAAAEHAVRTMCDQLLANPVIERFDFTVEPAAAYTPAT